ncbi:MAG: hypothetical protein FJX67_09520 [Alphaproteobacteria bacterium]|nr:hypothetical protein [Alphaproteobacteria bacterium]
MVDNLVRLDLARFTAADLKKIAALGTRLTLMHRWFRHDRKMLDGRECITVYSGDRGPVRYASYRICRDPDGTYELVDGRSGRRIATARTLDAVLAALPDDFFYARI